MRISSLGSVALALAVASGSAEAGFVMEIDDPNTVLEPDLRIEDNGPGDGNPELGLIEFIGYVSTFGGIATAYSKSFAGDLPLLGPGFPVDPDLLMDVSLFRSVTGGSLDIRVTDTHFGPMFAAGEAFLDVAMIGSGADGIQFDFFGDAGNHEFGRSFDIGQSEFFEAPIDTGAMAMGPAPAESVSSVTMSSSAFGFASGEINFAYVTAVKLWQELEPVPTPTATPTPTPTITVTPTPTATPTAIPVATPMPDYECQCIPHLIVPGGNLVALNKTNTRGKGSTRTKKVGVILKRRENAPGACHPGSSADTFSLRLHMADDDGDVILEETRTGLTCDRRVNQEKFTARFAVENCADSVAPDRSSKGEVTITATTESGELITTRTIKCNK